MANAGSDDLAAVQRWLDGGGQAVLVDAGPALVLHLISCDGQVMQRLTSSATGDERRQLISLLDASMVKYSPSGP